MANRRNVRRRHTELAFDALAIEGGLISADWLSKVAQLQAAHQAEVDYRIPKGLNLRDEIGRYWRMAQALWSEFATAPEGSASDNALAAKFIVVLLRDIFGCATLEPTAPSEISGRIYPIGHTALNGRVPVVIAGTGAGLDAPKSQFGDGGRRRSAFGLVQEYLNAADDVLWGVATDGLVLRIARDNASLTRPTWNEADLARIFTEERFADFAVLWLLIHETRFGSSDAPAADCILEKWRAAGREEGTRARDHLRQGVEEALQLLGQGFLSQPDNTALRLALHAGTLTTRSYFQQLLRLVYRLIFLLTVEERDLLHPADNLDTAKRLYSNGYGLRRLRERSSKRNAHDRFCDLWETLKITFRGVAHGEPRLALPPLGGLFAQDQCPTLDAARLENRALLGAVYRLVWMREKSGLSRVNWRDMGPEELGSVYESLLDLLPVVSEGTRKFDLGIAGNKSAARKLSGSYYTPDALVQLLLDYALEPLVAARMAATPNAQTDAVLQITVMDPACGSGHFLISAARRLAVHLARLQTNSTPSTAQYREALRLVISHCIYGVDRNPMAVELCKAALWIETVVPGRPLSFLDGHIRCGDALLGLFDLKLLDDGIPSEAYDARDGDEKTAAAALRQANKRRVTGASSLPLMAAAASPIRAVEMMPEDTVEQIDLKRAALFEAEQGKAVSAERLRADLFCAAFFSRKTADTQSSVPLTADIDRIAAGQPMRPGAADRTRGLAAQNQFFHWPLMFPEIFALGGFDIVLGNPPWEAMSPDVKEWFSPYDPAVREMSSDMRAKRLAEICSAPGVQAAWDAHCRALYDAAAFMKESGRFTLFAEGNLGKGDFNVYRMFVETALAVVRPGGVAAQFVPENLYNGANAAAIRAELFNVFRLRLLAGFENTKHIWFPAIDTRTKFCIYVAERGGATTSFAAMFGVNTHAKLEALRTGKTLAYPVAQVREFSSEVLAVAEIAHTNDIAIVQKLYARFPKFGEERADLARRLYAAEIHMGNDREDFSNDPNGVPLYEGRMIEAFDHRAKAYVSGRARKAVWRELAFGAPEKAIVPQWRISVDDIPDKVGARWQQYRIGFCGVGGATNQRFLMAALIPPVGPCGHSVPTIQFEPSDYRLMAYSLAVVNSFCLDYVVRKKTSLNITFSVMDSLPLPRAFGGTYLEQAIASRALRLAATGPDMQSFWVETAPLLGLNPKSQVPCEDTAERECLRVELDVLIARDLFGLSKDEMRYLLDPADILGADCGFETFGALQRAEIREHHEFRTQRLILETWNRLASPSDTPS
jgi:hypothetical protein